MRKRHDRSDDLSRPKNLVTPKMADSACGLIRRKDPKYLDPRIRHSESVSVSKRSVYKESGLFDFRVSGPVEERLSLGAKNSAVR